MLCHLTSPAPCQTTSIVLAGQVEWELWPPDAGQQPL